MKIDLNIHKNLTGDQKEIFNILKEVKDRYTPSTDIYAVGGFVRDMLIGLPSNDIDIMLSNVNGEDFSRLVTKHLGINDPHVIKSNPEKSKFITTAKAYLPLSSGETQEIDFARARQEVYHEDSRIPDIRPATAREDALRRDLTINSLFYNLSTRQVEDFTGKGIQDLITNTIRTPVDPLKTFKDDPLRIFRVIRFAAKYNGKIDEATYAAMTDPQLKEEIRQKISKERIGTEIKKMFSNPNATKAVELLKNTGLLDDIMSEALKGTKYEGKMAQFDMDQNNPNHKLNWWSHTFQVLTNTLEHFPNYEGEQQVTMVLAALTHDMGKLFEEIRVKKPGTDKYPDHEEGYTTYVGHEEESYEIAKHILKYLKLEPYIQQVSGLARYHMMPHSLVRDKGASDKALRKFIRRMGEFSLSWLDVLNLSIADAYSKDVEIDPSIVEEYKNLESRLQAALATISNDANVTTVKPILDGNEIMKILDIKPGPHMKEMGEFVKDLMDENPNITKEEAAAKLIEKFKSPDSGEIQTQASKEESEFSTCSNHVLQQKMQDLQDLIDDDKLYEANSVMNSLKEKYGSDEKITRLVAINLFKCLTKDNTSVNINLLQYILYKASENFFDYVLNAYAYGLLIMTKTSTNNNVIKEVASRVNKLSPGTLRFVVNSIPKTQIVNVEAADLVKDYLDLNRKGA